MDDVLIKNENITAMSFKEKTTQQIDKIFQLSRVKQMPLLSNWLSMPYDVSKEEKDFLEELRGIAEYKIPFWNEDELKMLFISPLLFKVSYNSPNYSVFAERTIASTFPDNIRLNGKADFMIASGNYDPEIPFFFFHEYKKEKGTADDPIGQLLCAMLVGQALNSNKKPVYGCYVLGRMWFFVVLNKKEYCISDAFVATSENQLEQIYTNLQNIKGIIVNDLL